MADRERETERSHVGFGSSYRKGADRDLGANSEIGTVLAALLGNGSNWAAVDGFGSGDGPDAATTDSTNRGCGDRSA